MNFFTYLNKHINNINSSKLIGGIAMIMLNLGSKYIDYNFSKSQEEYFRSVLGREIIIFIMAFVATRDLVISLILTSTFIILASFAFNEQSKFCVLPDKFKKMHKIIDKNDDGYISQKEINEAVKIIEKANKQQQKLKQMEMMSYFNYNK